MLPGEIKNSKELIFFLRQELALNPADMLTKEQEHIAADIVGLGVNDSFDEWVRLYPAFNKIFELASDLEWSNIAPSDMLDYWHTIEKLVDDLEASIKEDPESTVG